MLTSHANILVPPECGFIQWLAADYKDWSNELADSFIIDLLRTKKFETWGLTASDLQRQFRQDKPRSYAQACQSVILAYASHQNKCLKAWGDKNNYYVDHLRVIINLFPEARYIHIVRDGRDVLCSYRSTMAIDSRSPYKPKLPLNSHDVAVQWSNNVRKAMELLPKSSTTTIRYEDLVRRPKTELGKVCHSLKLKFEEEMLDFHRINKTHELEPQSTLDWKRKTLTPIDSESVGRYGSELEPSEREIFEQVAARELRAFGYI